jgi:hypothetical protein
VITVNSKARLVVQETNFAAISKQVVVKANGCGRQGTNARLHKYVVGWLNP